MLPTSDVGGVDAAVSHVLWCLNCAADIGGQLHTACTAPARERQASAVCRAVDYGESAIVLSRIADDASSGIHNSLELVCDILGRPSEKGVAIVHA